MEVSPFSFTPERYWTEEKERALIAFFSKHSCLWNHKSESYKNRQLRWKTLQRLRILLSSHPPPIPFTVEDIKNKFKNLRTTFQRQHKMVRASQVVGQDEVFVPQWKHYQQLTFLLGSWDQDDDSEGLQAQEESPPALPSPGLVISFGPNTSASLNASPSSSAPSSVSAKSCWTEEKERWVISFYSEHSCLWKKRSENHNNRQLRQKLLESLRSQVSDDSTSFSVEDIKCKFKNLRTVFNREYKAVLASQVSEKHYVSKWKHYQQLLFLCESCDEDAADLQILAAQEGQAMEYDTQPVSSSQTDGVQPSSTCAPSSSGQCDGSTSAALQEFLSAAADCLQTDNQTPAPSLPASPSPKSCGDPSLLNPSASGPVQPDGRVMADTRCLWSEAKVQQLIAFYSEHGCLWNHRSENYRNRPLRQSLLETLSGLLLSGRTQGRPARLHVPLITAFCPLSRSGRHQDKVPEPAHHLPAGAQGGELQQDLRLRGLLPAQVEALPGADVPVRVLRRGGGAAPPPRERPPPQSTPPSPTPPDSQLSTPSSSPSTASSLPDGRAGGRRRVGPPAADELVALMRTVCQKQTPHAGFLQYVEECLNEAPPDRVKTLKKKIIQTIHGVLEDV
ncbi:unnamed protein product [Menidia menidia]|uniref:(Atlantic silverside) hypothetical protein n=1 Tax=Menidia menidia TaxID=238744 RepID=A0A8S4ASE0_9TELE|nr:unnamed protein product [Menidia menidia]